MKKIFDDNASHDFCRDVFTMKERNPLMTYFEVILEVADVWNVVPEVAGKMLDEPLRQKLEAEALELNYLKDRRGGRLPI